MVFDAPCRQRWTAQLSEDTDEVGVESSQFRPNDRRLSVLGGEHGMHVDLSERLGHRPMLRAAPSYVSTPRAQPQQPRRGDTHQPGVKPLAVGVAVGHVAG